MCTFDMLANLLGGELISPRHVLVLQTLAYDNFLFSSFDISLFFA